MSNIHTSKMTGKLEGLTAISTNTITNSFCIKMNGSNKKNQICTKCYSHTMLKSYRKNMQPCLERNSQLLSSSILPMDELPSLLVLYIRINAHGELINRNHFVNIINIAIKNPNTNVVLWTKRKNLVIKTLEEIGKPDNLILIYSNPIISNILYVRPKFFDKTFNNVLENENITEQNCTGQKCKDCLLCYTFNDTTTIVEKVKKY